MNNNTSTIGQDFKVKDCTIIVRTGGIEPALNLRELRERIAICPLECLYHHFCETLIRPSFDYPEFRNDFAIWALTNLRDRVLAERLGIINPYKYESLDQLRSRVVEIIDERLDEVHYFPWVEKGEEFRFLQAVTIVFDTGLSFKDPLDFIAQLPILSTSSLYYHFIEARRRTPVRADDFTAWMKKLKNPPNQLIEALEFIDFYFLNLVELKTALYNATLSFYKKDIPNG